MQPKSLFSKIIYSTLFALIALSLIAAVLPQTVQAADDDSDRCEKTYVVKEGERIRRIANKYGITVNRLARTNNLVYPYELTPGQELCIPVTSTTVSTKGTWTATFKGDKITVEGSKFKKQNPFFVKVRENDNTKFFKLGKTVTDRDGDLSASFKAPKDLLKVTFLNVCLKDGITDVLTCKRVYRQ